MEGEDEDTGDERSFVRQKAWKKLLILLAGCGMNFLTGFVIIFLIYWHLSAAALLPDAIVGFDPAFRHAGEDGLQIGDVFYSIDGYRTRLHHLQGNASFYLSWHQGDTIDLVMLRDGKKVVLNDFPMAREIADESGNLTRFGLTVGMAASDEELQTLYGTAATLWQRIEFAWFQSLDFVQMVRFSLVQLFTGGASVQDLSGPVGIVSTISEVGEQSETMRDAWLNILYLGAFIAINLSVMNLLPIPALDGGRIFFLAADGVSLLLFRRKVPEKYQLAVNAAGMALLLGFMLLVTVQDVWKLFQ